MISENRSGVEMWMSFCQKHYDFDGTYFCLMWSNKEKFHLVGNDNFPDNNEINILGI